MTLPDGQHGVVCYSYDSTRLRESEERERDRAAELAALLDAVPTPVFIAHDPDCRHITGNRAADELLQIPRGGEASLGASSEARPRHFRAFKDGRELATETLPAQRAARGERVEGMEFNLVFDDGDLRDVIGYAVPLQNVDGQVRGSIHTLVDITEHKQAEEALRKAHVELERRVEERTAQLHQKTKLAKAERQQFYDVLETLPVYVCLLTPDYRIPFANRVFREWFGEFRPDQRCHEFLFHRSEPCENCETFKVVKTHGPHRWEWEGPNGRHYDIFDFPFIDTDGSSLILEMNIDITAIARRKPLSRSSMRRWNSGSPGGRANFVRARSGCD